MPSLLNPIQEILLAEKLVGSTWAADRQAAADVVALYRQYYDGQHRLKLTKEMKAMMQISDDKLDRYNANYCEMVISAMADRLQVEAVKHTPISAAAAPENPHPNPPPNTGEGRELPATDGMQTWVDNLLQDNRFDALQIKIRKAALRDGETFVMLQYSDVEKRVLMAHEAAFDGDTGVIVVYDSRLKNILAAVKLWWVGDSKFVNVYYPSLIARYQADENGQALTLLGEDRTERTGGALGVPVVRFGTDETARSELVNVIPLQDSLNRTLVSMVMASELTAFSMLFAVGWQPPAGITPGMILHAMIKDPTTGAPVVPESEEQARAVATVLNSYKLERIEGGDLSQLIGQANWLIGQIAHITSTPIDLGGADASGEAMKQRDVRLLGKLAGAQVSMGNSYEDMVRLAHHFQIVDGAAKLAALGRLSAQWKSAEIRSDTDILKAFELLMKYGHEREALRVLGKASFMAMGEDKINELMREKADDAAEGAVRAAGSLPGMEQFMVETRNVETMVKAANGNGRAPVVADNGVSGVR